MNSKRWLRYFENNRLDRPEPNWDRPASDPAAAQRELARSLGHFHVGESGEGTFLLAQARRFVAATGDADYYHALSLFIREEQEHARLLLLAVERFGARVPTGHWTQSLFRMCRRTFGLHFELQVLVIAEIVGSAYYRVLAARTNDDVLRSMCDLILRDEAAHVAFHAERIGEWHRTLLPAERSLCWLQFQTLFAAAATVAWLDHGACLTALGSTRAEFKSICREVCIRFIDRATQSRGAESESPFRRGIAAPQ
jgi:hypothetical protein